MFVNKDNDTDLAKLVRSSHSDSAFFPALIGSLPARLIAEIGVNKVQKDIKNIFLSNRFVHNTEYDSLIGEEQKY